jgi:hypothetical protein
MKVRISIEQIVDVEDAMSNDIEFSLYGPENMSDDDKIDYLVTRFCEDIDSLVKYDMVRDQITVDYLED